MAATSSAKGETDRGTRRVGGLVAVPALIRALNVDPGPVLQSAGVAAYTLGRPENRITHSQILALLDLAARRTRCGHFGLLSGAAWKIEDLGLLGEIMLNSPTVGRAIQELVLFQHLNSDGAAAFMIKAQSRTELGYAFYIPVLEDTSQFYAAALAAGVNFIRELAGPDWNPSDVLLPFPEPRDIGPYMAHFRAPLVFHAPRCAFGLPANTLEFRVVAASKDRLKAALRRARELGPNSTTDAVSRAIRTLLMQGALSGDAAAGALAMHRRTLTRRLAEEGTTFQKCLDRVRLTLARELIANEQMEILTAASMLGYSSPENFFRAFRRWTGETPSAWRERNRPSKPLKPR